MEELYFTVQSTIASNMMMQYGMQMMHGGILWPYHTGAACCWNEHSGGLGRFTVVAKADLWEVPSTRCHYDWALKYIISSFEISGMQKYSILAGCVYTPACSVIFPTPPHPFLTKALELWQVKV